MVDEIDKIFELNEIENDSHIRIAVRDAAKIPPGAPGICHECHNKSQRLVNGRCAPCRDGRGAS